VYIFTYTCSKKHKNLSDSTNVDEYQYVLYDKLYINVNFSSFYKHHKIWCKTRSRPPPQTPVL